jgi:hypothetical protein
MTPLFGALSPVKYIRPQNVVIRLNNYLTSHIIYLSVKSEWVWYGKPRNGIVKLLTVK